MQRNKLVLTLLMMSLWTMSSACVSNKVKASFVKVNAPVFVGCVRHGVGQQKCPPQTATPFKAYAGSATVNNGRSYFSHRDSDEKFGLEALRAIRKNENSFIFIDSIEIEALNFGVMGSNDSVSIAVKGFIHEK